MKSRRSILADDVVVSIAQVECDAISPAQFQRALRTLARLMVRSHVGKGDPVAITGNRRVASALTVAPHPSPHSDDEAA